MSALRPSASSVIAQARLADAGGLRQNGVGLAVHFLQKKVELLADLAARLEQRVQLPGVDLQPCHFLADVAAVGQQRGFLRQPLRFHARALEQLGQPLLQARLKGRRGAGANPFELVRGGAQRGRCVPRSTRGNLPALALAEGVERLQRLGERGFGVGGDQVAVVFSRPIRRTCPECAARRSGPALP